MFRLISAGYIVRYILSVVTLGTADENNSWSRYRQISEVSKGGVSVHVRFIPINITKPGG